MTNEDVELQDIRIIKSIRERIERENKHTENRDPPIIQRAPKRLRDHSEKSYIPRVVSIGPLYYRNNHDLAGMEGQKAKYMADLMKRRRPQEDETLKACVEKVTAKIGKIRSCYDKLDFICDDSKLVEIMVIDGCFILEFLYKISNCDDLGNYQLIRSTCFDLMLLENQIPFFVLEDLLECTISHLDKAPFIMELLSPILREVNCIGESLPDLDVEKITTPHHILGLLHKFYQNNNDRRFYFSSLKKHSAIELGRAGVKFKPMPYSRGWSLEIKVKVPKFPCFCCSLGKATIKMPILKIDDCTELVFRNLIAYEQSSEVGCCVTSYAMALDMLIDTQADIAKLVDEEVVYNYLGSNKKAANMVNRLCNDIGYVDFFYLKEWKDLDDHYRRAWPRNMAWLKRTYFNNPWNIIAFIAGIILFGLTVAQTYYNIHPVGSK